MHKYHVRLGIKCAQAVDTWRLNSEQQLLTTTNKTVRSRPIVDNSSFSHTFPLNNTLVFPRPFCPLFPLLERNLYPPSTGPITITTI